MSDPIRSISQNNYLLAAQQEVSHDNTLKGDGTTQNPLGLNETVLWDGNGTGSSSFSLSESMDNFERVRFVMKTDQNIAYQEVSRVSSDIVLMVAHGFSNAWTTWLLLTYDSNTNSITVTHSKSISHSFSSNSTTLGSALDTQRSIIVKVVGINRKSST